MKNDAPVRHGGEYGSIFDVWWEMCDDKREDNWKDMP
jgi:hypothetical protein